VRRHKMVNMILLATNETGGPVEQVRIAVGGITLFNLSTLAEGELSMPTVYNGPAGKHKWQVWLVDENGKRRRGSAICSVEQTDHGSCALIILHLADFIISKGYRLAGC